MRLLGDDKRAERGAAPADRRLRSLPEAAAELGLPRWRLYELVEARLIPHRRIGRRVMFTTGDLDAALAALAQPARSAGDA